MTIVLDRENLKGILQSLSPFDLRTAMNLLVRMEPDLHLSVRMQDLAKWTSASTLSLRGSIRRLEDAKLLLVRKRGRGPGAQLKLVINPSLGVDASMLPEFDKAFDRVQDAALMMFNLAQRSQEK